MADGPGEGRGRAAAFRWNWGFAVFVVVTLGGPGRMEFSFFVSDMPSDAQAHPFDLIGDPPVRASGNGG
jgi:hypothetical protein